MRDQISREKFPFSRSDQVSRGFGSDQGMSVAQRLPKFCHLRYCYVYPARVPHPILTPPIDAAGVPILERRVVAGDPKVDQLATAPITIVVLLRHVEVGGHRRRLRRLPA